MHLKLINLLLFSTFTALIASEENDITIHKNLFRTTYEKVQLPSNIKPLGLLGINFLRKTESNFYFGGGIYGSVEGERGGFFSGGLEVGYQYPITEKILFDAGAFVGGGSGDNYTIFGNGLMVRLHSGLLYNLGDYQIGAYYSKVTFPNSQTDSNHFGIQLDIPFENVTTNLTDSKAIYKALGNYNNDYQLGWQDHHYAMTLQHYTPRDNSESVGLIGFEYRENLNRRFFYYLEASEAITGNAAGYAEILGGFGYIMPITSNFGLSAKLGVGSGGGSGINVEGGLLYKANAGLYLIPFKNINLGFELGYIDAPQGNFSAISKKVSVAYSIPFLTIGKGVRHFSEFQNAQSGLWRFRASTQRYLASNHIRTSKINASADLMSFKFDRFLTDNFYATGQGFGAIKGDIAGYGGGFLGFGYNTDPFIGNLSAFTELLVGTGGAGDVDTGEGLLAEGMIGLNYSISDSFDIQVGIGRVKALASGNLNETVIDAGIAYKFRTIEPH